MDRNIAIVNSVFTLDASPPVIPLQLVNLKGILVQYNIKAFDLDIGFYQFLCCEKVQYDMTQYLLGGFAFSYPTTANIPSNYYPFETMPMADLLISMMYLEDLTPAISNACEKLGIKYDDAEFPMKRFMDYLEECQKTLKDFDEIIFTCNSIASAYFGILLAHRMKTYRNDVKIYTVGKNMLIPEIKKFVDSLELVDRCFENIFELGSYFDVDDSMMDCLDFDAIDIRMYNKKLGLHSVNLSCSEGCPGKCNFCSIRLSWNQKGIKDKFKYYSLQSTISKLNQIERCLGKCFVHIDDCTFNSGSSFSYKLLEYLKRTKMLYSCNLRGDTLDEEFISKLKASNFYKVIVGVETLNEKTVKILNKGSVDYVSKIKKSIEKLIDQGIAIQINILLFHPMESREDILEGVEKWKQLFNHLNHKKLHNYEAPIGTLCLNYPSKMYFDVLKSEDFKIVHHILPQTIRTKVTDKTRKAYENIPNYAIRVTDKEEDLINKMKIVAEVYRLSKWDETIMDNYIGNLLNYADSIMEAWISNKTAILKRTKFDLYQPQNKLIEMIKNSFNWKTISVAKLRDMVTPQDYRTLVVTLSMLSRAGFIEFDIYNINND